VTLCPKGASRLSGIVNHRSDESVIRIIRLAHLGPVALGVNDSNHYTWAGAQEGE
jgi:hypothetical protein